MKLLSSDDAPVEAIREMMGLDADEPIGEVTVGLGTTRGTNALLERKGAEVALVTTRGFADLLEIGTQARPELFKLHVRKPEVLHRHVVEVDERIDAEGNVIEPMDDRAVESALIDIHQQGISAVAVCLLNAYVNDEHEQRVARIARRTGFAQVSVSTELSPTINALNRFDTTVLDAYLSPVVNAYLENLMRQMPQARLKVMTSAGAMVEPGQIDGKDSLLSGPAGGVVGCAQAATKVGFSRALGFDMGGTSTDVCRYDGRYEYRYSGEIADTRVVAPMLAIETVAAGGGSVCEYDGQRLTVGPHSAGADPGPACYGRGGPLAITDVNLFNGKIDPKRFPFPLDIEAVLKKFDELAERSQGTMSPRQIADGFTRVANEHMASAIKRISAARGYDPADHALVAFGGAAAQHACAIARSLGIRQILLHPLAGVLSAHGISMADVRRFAERSVLKTLNKQTLEQLEPTFRQIEERLRGEVLDAGVEPDDLALPVRLLDLRYAGEHTPVTITQPDDGRWAKAFEEMHRQLYGHVHHDRAIEIATLRVEQTGYMPKPEPRTTEPVDRVPEPDGTTTVYFDVEAHETPWYERSRLHPGDRMQGPAIIYEDLTTIVIDPGWRVRMNERYDLLLTDDRPKGRTPSRSVERDPIRLELFNNHFSHIATQMGVTLQRTSLSVNVKERLDFSCAVLDAEGRLVVNGPHMPVHLGAMGATVRGLIERVDDLRPGDAYLTNDPDLGGSHLPDLTVMTPVFDPSGNELRFFTASRAHHAEIGGLRPGSTFPWAKNLFEEGVVFRNMRLSRGGHFDERALRDALCNAPYPSRLPDENVADIRAALAANTLGARELSALIEQHTWPVVRAYMGHIRDAAYEKCRAAIGSIPDGRYERRDQLDDGAPIVLAVTVHGERMAVDFTGTGPVNPNAFNANRAIVNAALMYCLRCIIDEDIPLNAGVLETVEVVLPECMLNPPVCEDPAKHAAVAAGNVELSQRVVDLFLGALGVLAACQGTMNNLVFGDGAFGYYETICGGAGAGPGFAGADAVHTHMTNTRMTDVEVLERRYPVRLRTFAVRHGSGGVGRYPGGAGVTRSVEFLKPLQVSLLTQRRSFAPFGLAGGGDGEPGRNSLRRANATTNEALEALAQFDVQPHDVLTIQTPGGGGYGCKS